MAPTPTALVESADDAARLAAQQSGTTVASLHELAHLHGVVDLFKSIWRRDRGDPLVTIEQLRGMAHAGNYVAGVFDGGTLVGACIGFFGAPASTVLHSHIAGVAPGARGRSIGFALKLHQRAWALKHGLAEITWTFDPLVRRNAYFNLAKLGARPRGYLVDFYGDLDDAINDGHGSDRLLMTWALTAQHVVAACSQRQDEPEVERAFPALVASASGRPQARPASARRAADLLLVDVPADIEALRRSDPALAQDWRGATRDVLGELITAGARVTGFSRRRGYVVESSVR